MMPSYDHKFVLYSDIADALTGFVRMIEFRCFAMPGQDPRVDVGMSQ